MRSISLTLLVWLLSFPALSMAAGPTDQVRSTIDKVLEMVRTPSLKSPDQKKDFRSQLAELISPRFDFAEMAKRALGPQWARRSPDEQREFVKLFADLLGRSYAERIEAYSNQSVAYTREVEDKDYAEVDTTVVSDKQEKVSINYKLHVLDKE